MKFEHVEDFSIVAWIHRNATRIHGISSGIVNDAICSKKKYTKQSTVTETRNKHRWVNVKKRNSSALAMELRLSCSKPLIYNFVVMTVLADGLEPFTAWSSAGMVVIALGSRIYRHLN